MKLPVVSILLLLPFCSFGQGKIDSLRVSKVMVKIDSISLLTARQWNIDSLKISFWSSSIRSKVLKKFTLDSLNIIAELDSAGSRKKDFIQYKLDSLIHKKESLLNEVRSRQCELLKRSRGKLDEWHAKVKQKFNIDKVHEVEAANFQHTSMPSVKSIIPDDEITKLSLNDLNVPELDIRQIPEFDIASFENLNLSADLVSFNSSFSLEELDAFKNIQDGIGDLAKGFSNVSETVQNPSQVLEQSFMQMKDVSLITDQVQQAEAFMDNDVMRKAEMLKDPEVMNTKLKKEAFELALNHFAGKEQVLQQAMDQMEKYKNKYESLNNLEQVKKLPKNSMRGKAFSERFVPGVAFQFHRNDDLFLDINSYAGYRITGKFTAGAGWNQRVGYSLDKNQLTSVSVIYGPRLFADIDIWKSVSSRFEAEWMNTTVPRTVNRVVADRDRREWVFTPLLGIKKEQRIFKSVKGTILLMFNIYNPLHKSPYGDLIYSRIGFEFSLNSRNRKSQGG